MQKLLKWKSKKLLLGIYAFLDFCINIFYIDLIH